MPQERHPTFTTGRMDDHDGAPDADELYPPARSIVMDGSLGRCDARRVADLLPTVG